MTAVFFSGVGAQTLWPLSGSAHLIHKMGQISYVYFMICDCFISYIKHLYDSVWPLVIRYQKFPRKCVTIGIIYHMMICDHLSSDIKCLYDNV